MSHIPSQVLGAPLICGGRLEGAMVKWMFKNLDWCWWKRCTCTYSGPPVWPPWSQVADRTHCRRDMCTLHPEGFFLYLTEFTRFWIGLGKYSSVFLWVWNCEPLPYVLWLCWWWGRLHRSPEPCRRPLFSTELLAGGFRSPPCNWSWWGCQWSWRLMRRQWMAPSNPHLFVDKQFFGFLFREADLGL